MYQTLHIFMISPLKILVRRQYHDHIHRTLQDDARSSKFKSGDKVLISRENLIDFVEKSHDDVNSDNVRKLWIVESFNKC